jgi:predicted CXXCH cytochrome family protein
VLIGALLVVTLPLAGWAARRHLAAKQRHDEIVATVPQQTRPGYSTSDRCEACHPSEYQSWHRGYHRTMTQYASPATVRGDFDDVHLKGDGYDVHLFRRGDDFMVDMVDPLWQYEVDVGQRPPPPPGQAPPRVERRVSMVTGSHRMQAYWVPSNVGNGQLSLPFTYLYRDHRWVPRGEVFLHPPAQRQGEQVWNVGCITCHTTAGQPLALVGGKEIKTRVAEMGIACEACHGPGEAHIAANQDPMRRYWLHLRGRGDPTIVNPARLPAARAAQVCGQCHGLTDLSDDIYLGQGKKYVAGDDLEKTQPLLRPLHPTPALARHLKEDPDYLRNYFWADGTIRVSSRDYSGMIESKCMQSGKLWCESCHSQHKSDPVNLLAEGKDGDGACVQCHAAIGGAVAAHTHHRVDSSGSRCTNCHMPHTVYGLLKAIRNHRIDSPKVTGRSGKSERPNACNLCHLDRSLGWTAQQLARWYHQPVPAGLTDETPAAVAWLLSGDAVLRAIAAWHFGWAPAQKASAMDEAVPYLVAALADPYAAVRYVVGHSLESLVPDSKVDYLATFEERQRTGGDILRRWLAQRPATERDPGAVDAQIKRLIDERDDTPVRAME